MAVRATMTTSLIPRVRLLINDPSGTSPIFQDQDIQDVLDESRQDVFNMPLNAKPTFSGNTLLWLDYETDLGGWEDGMVLRQFLTVVVTPSLSEPIAGHWQFAATTLPPVFITGRLYDVYHAAADLLERLAGRWMLRYDVYADGQNLKRSQVAGVLLEKRIQSLRKKQRVGTISLSRADLGTPGRAVNALGPTEIDYMSSG